MIGRVHILRSLTSLRSARLQRFTTKSNTLPTLTLYTKEECSLCDIAKEDLRHLMHLVNFQEVHIDEPGNEDWFEKYKYDIPVFHLDGSFLMKHKANPKLLERKLKELKENGTSS